MNWIVFAAALWLLTGVEFGLLPALELGDTGVVPSALVVLLVFVCLWTRTATLVLACLAVGVVLDLMRTVAAEGADVAVLGPHTLGCLLAGALVLNVRALLYRRGVLSLAFLSLLGSVLIHITATFLLGVRAVYDVIEFGRPGAELGRQLLCSLYTAVLALVAGFALNAVRPLFGFERDTKGGFRIE